MSGVPADHLQTGEQPAGLGFGRIDVCPVVGAVLGQPEGLAQSGHALLAAEKLAGPQDRQHHI